MTNAERQGVGERVAELRRSLGISQSELGRMIGEHQMWVSRTERGDRPLGLSEAHSLAVHLGTSLDYLATGDSGSGGLSPSELRVRRIVMEAKDLHRRLGDALGKEDTDDDDTL